MIYILSGNYEQSDRLAHELSIQRGYWRHLFKPESLQGLNGNHLLIKTGTWYERSDRDTIEELINFLVQNRLLRVVHINLDELVRATQL